MSQNARNKRFREFQITNFPGGGGVGGGETCPWTPDKGNMDKHLLCNKPPFQQPTQFILYIYFIF